MSGLYQQKPRRNQGKSEASCPLDTAAPSSTTAFQGRMHLQHWIHDIEFEAISFCQPVLGYFAEEMGHSIQWKPICPGFRLWKKCLLLHREKYSKQWIKNLCRLKLASEKGVFFFCPSEEIHIRAPSCPKACSGKAKITHFLWLPLQQHGSVRERKSYWHWKHCKAAMETRDIRAKN